MKDFINALGKDGLKSAYSLLESFALYLTIAIAVILLVAFIVIRFRAKDKMQAFKPLALGVSLGYAITITAVIAFLMVARMQLKEELDTNYYLMLGFFALLFVYAISALITALVSKKAFKITNFIGIILAVAYGVVLLCFLPTASDEYAPLSKTGMYIFTAVLVLAIALPTIFFGKDTGTANPTRSLAYAGVCIALSFALSYVKLFSLPQGGSVTLASMLPLIIYSYVFGARKGVFAGVIYGVLQCLQSPQIYQPLQVLIDYPIAFATIGLAGIVKNIKWLKTPLLKFIFGASLACILRYCAHFISGYYVFSSWAMEGYTAFTWSLVYNLYLIAELGIILAVGCALFASKGMVKQLDRLNPEYSEVSTASENEGETSAQEIKVETAEKNANDN